jgi:hypothetical protein
MAPDLATNKAVCPVIAIVKQIYNVFNAAMVSPRGIFSVDFVTYSIATDTK